MESIELVSEHEISLVSMDLANLGWRSVIELSVSIGCSISVFELLVLGSVAILTVFVDDEC